MADHEAGPLMRHQTDDQVAVLGVAGQQPEVVCHHDTARPTSKHVVIATPHQSGLGGAFFGGGGV